MLYIIFIYTAFLDDLVRKRPVFVGDGSMLTVIV